MTAGNDTIGPNAQVERVLANYGLEADNLVDDLVESDEIRLQLATLLEARGDDDVVDAEVEASRDHEGVEVYEDYASGSIETGAEPKMLEYDFDARSLVLRRVTSPVWVAFRPPADDQTARVQVSPAENPFSISPPGLSVSKVWVGRPENSKNSSLIVGAWG